MTLFRTLAAFRTPLGRWVSSPGGPRGQAILLALYLSITAAGVARHEPYRDEARKWLLARDAASLSELVRSSPYEGAPALWPLLLRIPARGGLPYASMSWLNWGLMGAAAAVLLRCAPLPLLFKVALLSSYVMQYEYAVKARNYSVSIFLIFASIALYAVRRKRPWMLGGALFLLANSSLWGAVFVVPLLALMVGDRLRKSWRSSPDRIPIALASLGLVSLLAQLIAPWGGNSAVQKGIEAGWRPLEFFPNAYYAFFITNSILPFQTLCVLAVVFLGIVFLGLLGRPRALFFFGSCAAILEVIYGKMGSDPRHGGFLALAVTSALWMASIESAAGDAGDGGGGLDRRLVGICALAAVIFSMSIPGAVRGRTMDRSLPFSGSRHVAAFLLSKNLLQVPIAAHRPDNVASVLPYFPQRTQFYYPALEEFRAYAGQNRPIASQERLTFPMAAERSFLRFSKEERFLLLFNQAVELPARGRQCKLLYHSPPAMIHDEDYWLYECRP